MRLSLRRRVLIALLIAFPVGWMYIDIGWRLLVALLVAVRGDDAGSIGCRGSGLPGLFATYNGCDSDHYHHGYAAVELVIGTAVALVISWGLARFVTAPLRQVTDSVEQLGPTNLGLRIRHRGSRSEELRRLSDAIDGMLDRVSEGYEAQRRFASTASHELRTPLATQRALIEVSLGSALTEEQLELLSRQLLATNERNEKLIDGLLTLAETERGLIATGAQPLDRVAADAVEMLRSTAKERGVELRTELVPTTVAGELPLLDRLVTNLVHNAIKYNVEDGWVLVTVAADGALIVTNTGPPVPPELVAGLFEPFRRMSGERLDHGGGVGLGLTIARSIVAAHGGSISAQANPSVGGLTVRVNLVAAR